MVTGISLSSVIESSAVGYYATENGMSFSSLATGRKQPQGDNIKRKSGPIKTLSRPLIYVLLIDDFNYRSQK